MKTITPCIWFDRNAQEAVEFYTSIFPNSAIGTIAHYGKAGFEVHHMPEGTVLFIEFTLNGQLYWAMNGGPAFKPNLAISFMVPCASQKELDHYWSKLGAGGDPAAQQCGWLKDKFGVSWQIVPTIMSELMADPKRSDRVMAAFMNMKKMDIETLKAA